MKTNEEQTSMTWRLKEELTTDRVQKLVDIKVITPEEAKKLLFKELTESDEIAALKEQVKFLQGVVDKLTSQPPQVVYKYIDDYTPKVRWMETTTPTPYKLIGLGPINHIKLMASSGSTIGTGMMYGSNGDTSPNAVINPSNIVN